MSTQMISVEFSHQNRCEIPLADLTAVCRVGSDYAIRLPVASKDTFDHFQTFVNKHKPKPAAPDPDWDWDYYIRDWEFIEQFKDKDQLYHLEAVALLTEQYRLEHLCSSRIAELTQEEAEEDDHVDDDDDGDYDDDYNTVIMMKSPSPDRLPADEDEFWEDYTRDDFMEKSPSSDTLSGDEDEYEYWEDRESPSP